MPVTHKTAEHHVSAATHHEEAARHHRLAAEHCASGKYGLAAQEAEIAHDHAQKSALHDHEIVNQYFDRNIEFDEAAKDIINWAELKVTG
jgi:hypothetical protein